MKLHHHQNGNFSKMSSSQIVHQINEDRLQLSHMSKKDLRY